MYIDDYGVIINRRETVNREKTPQYFNATGGISYFCRSDSLNNIVCYNTIGGPFKSRSNIIIIIRVYYLYRGTLPGGFLLTFGRGRCIA